MNVAPGQTLGESLDDRQKWLLLGSLMVSLFVGALDQTVVTTATPRILADLGGFGLLSWLFTSYMLASTVVICSGWSLKFLMSSRALAESSSTPGRTSWIGRYESKNLRTVVTAAMRQARSLTATDAGSPSQWRPRRCPCES